MILKIKKSILIYFKIKNIFKNIINHNTKYTKTTKLWESKSFLLKDTKFRTSLIDIIIRNNFVINIQQIYQRTR